MVKLKRFITEKLALSQAKHYTALYDRDRYSEWFNNEHRIYIPLKKTDSARVISDIYHEVEKKLSEHKYKISNYQLNKAYPIGGDKDKPIKISKLLKKFGYDDLLKKFSVDPVRSNIKSGNLYIVISRHPYDIAGMSTDRNWTSCMNIDEGYESYYIEREIEIGTIIAYLVGENDKNINKPYARVLLKPFYNYKGDTALRVGNIYGNAPRSFKIEVENWLYEKQGSNQGYTVKNEESYDDEGFDMEYELLGKKIEFEEIVMIYTHQNYEIDYLNDFVYEVKINRQMLNTLNFTSKVRLGYDSDRREIVLIDDDRRRFTLEENSDKFLSFVDIHIQTEDGDRYYSYDNKVYMRVPNDDKSDYYNKNKYYVYEKNIGWVEATYWLLDNGLMGGNNPISSDFKVISKDEVEEQFT